MGSPKQPIQSDLKAADVAEYLASESSFAFEMSVMRALLKLGFTCLHGGTYVDPVQRKFRQYDIRATKNVDLKELSLAVECKRLSASNPLLAYCVPRTAAEAFLETVAIRPEINRRHTIGHSRHGGLNLYPVGGFVAKKLDQVSRSGSGFMTNCDREVFDKYSQAISSAHDLVVAATKYRDMPAATAVLPVLVVPSGTLWVTRFDEKGASHGAPEPATHVSLFIGSRFTVEGLRDSTFVLTHLEIVTDGVLSSMVAEFGSTRGALPCANQPDYFGRWYDGAG